MKIFIFIIFNIIIIGLFALGGYEYGVNEINHDQNEKVGLAQDENIKLLEEVRRLSQELKSLHKKEDLQKELKDEIKEEVIISMAKSIAKKIDETNESKKIEKLKKGVDEELEKIEKEQDLIDEVVEELKRDRSI